MYPALGHCNIAADITGSTSFTVTFLTAVTVGHSITSTATDPTNNTSEFSRCIVVEAGLFTLPALSRYGVGALAALLVAASLLVAWQLRGWAAVPGG